MGRIVCRRRVQGVIKGGNLCRSGVLRQRVQERSAASKTVHKICSKGAHRV